jgi:Holliday junction resolvase
MKEKEFEIKVKAFLKDRGCWVLKTWSNGVQRQGIPDLLVCCNGFFIGVELKAEKGRPSNLQLWNIEEIRKAGGIAIVLYPDQFERFKDMILELERR